MTSNRPTLTEQKKLYKRELNEVLNQKAVLQQMIHSVTHREFTIREALEKLGAPMLPKKKKYELDPEVRMRVMASLTR